VAHRSVVTAQLIADGHEVTVLDDLSTGHADAVPAGARLVCGDIRSAGERVLADGIDAVLHFAAKSLVAESVAQPSLYWRGNLVYNLGSGSGYSNREVLAACQEVTGRQIPFTIGPRRPGDPAVLIASPRRITAELGWRPERGLREMAADAWMSACARLGA
jgi:UDP-glucose 4-epimerase